MEIEKGKTSEAAKENLKNFSRIKKSILEALREDDLTIDQLSQKLNMPKHEVVFYLMTLLKYGLVQTGAIDDMDEYFYYKLKK
jgi:predicted transcriptional regulator